jgi:Flp pilus assembly pilin Flp
MKHFCTLWTDECGQDLAEYAVLIGFVALAVVVAVALLGDSISALFNDLGTSLGDAASVQASGSGQIGP